MNIDSNSSVNLDNSSDNASSDFTQEDIMSALDEPEYDTESTQNNENAEPETKTDNSADNTSSKDNTQDKTTPSVKEGTSFSEYPAKFKNEDGTVNYDNLLKSYKELEPLLAQKAQWEKERAELLTYKDKFTQQQSQNEEIAKQQGYSSAQDMEQEYQLANLEANEYAKYLNYTENPENVRRMLLDYINNPNNDLLSDIELEFPANVIKTVAIAKERQRQQFQNYLKQQAETQKMSNIESVISKSVDSHNELFEYEPFRNLFLNTLHKYGDNFTQDDAQALMNTMVQMKELFKEEFSKQSNKDLQNKKAIDAITSIDNTNSAQQTSQNLDISKMNDKQLVKYLKDFV